MRSIKDKRAKTSKMMYFFAFLAVVAVGGLFYFATSQDISNVNPNNPATCADSTGILTVNAVSKLDGASDPSSPTVTCGVGSDKVKTSVTSGTTTFPVGARLTCLVSKDDYIDASFEDTMDCGGLQKQVEMYYATSDNPAIAIKDPNNGDSTVTDAVAGGATNLTNPSAGSTVDFDVELKGTSTEGTGEMVYIIEFPASSSGNITKVTMGDLSQLSLPMGASVVSAQNAGSYRVAFAVPNIEGSTKRTYSVIATLQTSSDLTGGVYTDLIAGQEFIDDDGFIKSGIEDSDGTDKSENNADYDFWIA